MCHIAVSIGGKLTYLREADLRDFGELEQSKSCVLRV